MSRRLTDPASHYLVNNELFTTGYIAKEQTGAYSKDEIEEAIDRLATYEDLGAPEDIATTQAKLKAYEDAEKDGLLVRLPMVAMIEQTLVDGKFSPKQRDQALNGRYAVVYVDKKKWGSPLIDICGNVPYKRDEAEAQAALKEAQG